MPSIQLVFPLFPVKYLQTLQPKILTKHAMIDSYKIIVVDDNESFLRNIIFFLEVKWNHQVINSYRDGEDAVKGFLNENSADLILMDINMPGMNGVEATWRILQRNPRTKIIGITQDSSRFFLKRLNEVGFKGLVFKRNLFNELPLAIDKVMKGELCFSE